MSWIFGVCDNGGLSIERVREAAARLAVSGPISLVGDARCAFGSVGHDPAASELGGGVLAAADARLDADGDEPLHLRDEAAATWLAHLVRQYGVDALDRVAGDFALAMFDPNAGTLLLARDLAGIRPLYWARLNRAAMFSSDPAFILAYGGLGSQLDRETTVRYLSALSTDPFRTGLRGVSTFPGGRVVILRTDQAMARRWFRPELDVITASEEAPRAVRDAILASVGDRVVGERPALWLSGGRDSGALAVALGEVGAPAMCFTMAFDPEICASETKEASELARSLGFGWTGVDQPTSLTEADLAQLPMMSPTPLTLPFVRSSLAGMEAMHDHACTTMLDGIGGELFAAQPIALLDLLRRGRLTTFGRASRAFNDAWVHPYATQWRTVARGVAPPRVLKWRESLRPFPPWALPGLSRTLDPTDAPRSDEAYTLAYLHWIGAAGLGDSARMHKPAGIIGTSPYLDRRVIRAALRLRLEDRLPTPVPKPVLANQLLGPHASTRVKGDQTGWFLAVARQAESFVSAAASPHSRLATAGLIRPFDPGPAQRPEWRVNSLRLVAVEAWLRRNSGGP